MRMQARRLNRSMCAIIYYTYVYTHTFVFETVKTFGIDIGTTALTIDSQQEHILQFTKEILNRHMTFSKIQTIAVAQSKLSVFKYLLSEPERRM